MCSASLIGFTICLLSIFFFFKNKINFSYVPTQKLDRLSNKNHQGVIARIAPIKFYTIDSFSEVLEKSNNPFAYFTQIIYYAFLRRIQKEKKQLEIKTKIIERTGYDQVMVVEEGASGSASDYNSIKDNIQYRLNR